MGKQTQKIATNNAFTPHVYEIHGNIYYMHCSDETHDHSRTFHKSPSVAEARAYAAKEGRALVPKCPECGANMKPHCMFFDETYSEHYYRSETLRDYEQKVDCLIVIGTALATTKSKNLIVDALMKETVPVIEVNMESSIDNGFNV
jgi:NAD-dependent SIR2 family protein deacetylase